MIGESFALHDTQKIVAADIHRFRVVCCGRRWGKSTLAAYEILGHAIGGDDRNCAFIAPTYRQARDIIWGILLRIARPVLVTVNEGRLEITVRTVDGGLSMIRLRGWESVESLRGQRIDFMVLDEVASYKDFVSGWQEVLRPTLTDTRGGAIFISSPAGYNHFHSLYEKANIHNPEPSAYDRDYSSYQFTSFDNPHLPREELEKAREELSPDRFSQEYLASFTKVTGLVFKEFDRNRHIYTDQPKAIVETFTGVDWGFTNPAAVMKVLKDYDRTYYVDVEYYKTRRTEEEIADAVTAQVANLIYPDPENASAIEVLRRRKLPVRPVIKGKDSIVTGINIMRDLFFQNRLRINARCVHLIQELETYVYPEEVEGQHQKELPIDENNHAIDAVRYVLMMQEAARNKKTGVSYNHKGVPGGSIWRAVARPFQ